MHFQLVSVLALASLSIAATFEYHKQDQCTGPKEFSQDFQEGCHALKADGLMSIGATLGGGQEATLFTDEKCTGDSDRPLGDDGCFPREKLREYPYVKIHATR
ncbi:hypothetical protein N7492_003276 [Penicillium capsulatum]|uniref:Uncharacterized protein n=1 Tax=Penicillium capsulatum TaxID=69766 RepID=A0A9W9IMT9_9EURO|nr:hypothetical protein N7492_003276 [Penicillium capsulatum]